ncbi:septin-7 isoform X3 [Planococcus citri]|uniref:septin-7 isoform X3 n=1 Tax=Planococcus citri TaxID=170843 RepID=UPI0031F80E8D
MPEIVVNVSDGEDLINGQDEQIQSKRELFFKNELPSSTPSSTTTPVTTNSNSTTTPTKPDILNGNASIITNNSTSQPATSTPSIYNKENYAKKPERNGPDVLDMKERINKVDKEKTTVPRITKELDGYVGFANFPNQVYRKAIKKGFEFTLMVVGESGLGKSTLINSLFLSDVYSAEYLGPSHRIKKTVQVETSRCLLKENGVNLVLTIVDTPGFGDAVDNSNCWQPIIDYIESRSEEYLNAESRVNRKPISDTRVHCCLYFIAPSGHGLKPLDVEFMQRLHDKVNIIPIIAKADTMIPEEIAYFKKQILSEIAQHKIKIYDFPECINEEDLKLHKNLRDRVPFAVVGSNTVLEVDGKKVRGRKYPWGVAQVENLEHCDFIALRDMMIRTHLQDLKDVTNNILYENYRCRKLGGSEIAKQQRSLNNPCSPGILDNTFMTFWNPLAQMEEEKREHSLKMKKMEAEMEQVFESKVKEKELKMKESETDLQRRHEQMKKQLDAQIRELKEKRQQLEAEKLQWEQANGVSLEELRRKSLERDSLDGKEKKIKKKGLF